LVEGYVRPLYLAALYQKKIAIGNKGFPWTFNSGVEYRYDKGLCPVVEHMHESALIYTPLIREPMTEADIDTFADAIGKVLAHRAELTSLP